MTNSREPKVGETVKVSDRANHRGNGSEPCVGKYITVSDVYHMGKAQTGYYWVIHGTISELRHGGRGGGSGMWAVYWDDCDVDPQTNKEAKSLLKK